MPAQDSPAQLLARREQRDATRPFVTYYDAATGGRVELSVATFHNWVAKTAGLLHNELGMPPGALVSVVLPAHWLGLVWAQAVWTAGGRLSLGGVEHADVAVCAQPAQAVDADELVLVGTAPLGGPARVGLPDEAWDFGRVVLGQPDRFTPAPLADATVAAALARARGRAAVGARLLVTGDALSSALVEDALLVPLACDAECVLVTGEPTPEQVARIQSDEHAVRLR